MQLSNCVCFNLRKAARRVSQAYDLALQPTGLRVTQFSLLALLNNRPPMPISVLAEEMGLDRTTLSRNLGPLREAGLLTLRPGRDARVQEVSITEAGKRRHGEALPHWRKIQHRVADLMGGETLTRLLADLEGLRTVVSQTVVSRAEDSSTEFSSTEFSSTEFSSTEFSSTEFSSEVEPDEEQPGVQVKRVEVQRIQVQRIEVQRFSENE